MLVHLDVTAAFDNVDHEILFVVFHLHTACGCNSFGSVRDDCEQMTGRCMCRPAITGTEMQPMFRWQGTRAKWMHRWMISKLFDHIFCNNK